MGPENGVQVVPTPGFVIKTRQTQDDAKARMRIAAERVYILPSCAHASPRRCSSTSHSLLP